MTGFTPFHSGLGGLVLGVAAVGKLALTGRILGISGTARGIFRGDWSPWRFSFLSGMVSGAYAATRIIPGVFESLPISILRATLGGLLVGVGASMGNGCTSGHGICGNARLSLRSAVYTVLFMGSAFVTAAVSKTAAAFQLPASSPQYVPPNSTLLDSARIVLLLTVAALAIPVLVAKLSIKKSEKLDKVSENVAEFSTGSLFGLGLGLSGMTLPSKIVAFLSPLEPAFDLSLIFVMGGALLVATPAMQYMIRKQKMAKSVCGLPVSLPSKKTVDAKLLLGGVLFGAGWGISGMCPGPAILNLLNPSKPLIAHLAALGLGFVVDTKVLSPMLEKSHGN